MTSSAVTYAGGPIFDGLHMHEGKAARFRDGAFLELIPAGDVTVSETVLDLAGDILSPGFVDVQVNGGDGVMFNDNPSVATLRRIAKAHRSLGVSSILPTLITDTPDQTRAAIDAARAALTDGVPGIAGLHLEGPHLSVVRKGAHDAALIRPMEPADLEQLIDAKQSIPKLKVTIAPENVTQDQVTRLTRAGILVSLGHTDADFETCLAYAKAGARCVTHLFNAMSQLGNREPGLVGAALACGDLSAGLISDTVHVHPATMRAAWHGKTRPGEIFLISDAMAVAGTEETQFSLGGRRITRANGRLTLDDNTLAGADLDLTTAVRVLIDTVGLDPATALQAATSIPARLIGLSANLEPEHSNKSNTIRIAKDFSRAALLEDVSNWATWSLGSKGP